MVGLISPPPLNYRSQTRRACLLMSLLVPPDVHCFHAAVSSHYGLPAKEQTGRLPHNFVDRVPL